MVPAASRPGDQGDAKLLRKQDLRSAEVLQARAARWLLARAVPTSATSGSHLQLLRPGLGRLPPRTRAPRI